MVVSLTTHDSRRTANTLSGVRSVEPALRDLFRLYGASRFSTLIKLELPAAIPNVITGLRIASGLAVIGAIVGEFVGAKAGLGYLLLQKNFNFDMAGTFAVLVVLSLIGVALHSLIRWIQRRVIFWMDTSGSGSMFA